VLIVAKATPYPSGRGSSPATGAIGRAPRGRLSDLLVESGVVGADAVAQAMQQQDFTGKRLGTILVESGVINEYQLAAAIAHQAGLPVIDFVESEPSRLAVAAVDSRTARAVKAIPLRSDGSVLDVAVANGLPMTRERLEEATGRTVRLYVAPEMQIEALLDIAYPQPFNDRDLAEVVLTAPVITSEAAEVVPGVADPTPTDGQTAASGVSATATGDGHGVSDGALPPGATEERASLPEHGSWQEVAAHEESPVRPTASASAAGDGWLRRVVEATDPLDAVLELAIRSDVITVAVDMLANGTALRVLHLNGARRSLTLPNEVGQRLISAARIAAGQDPQVLRMPGTGQFQRTELDHDTVVRVDTLPTIHGHSMTLRFVRPAALHELDDLGMPADVFESIDEQIRATHGLIVVAGKSGSGRSTTLRAIVRQAMKQGKRALLLETSPRQLVAGANQTELDGLAPHETIRAARGMDADLLAIDGVSDRACAQQALAGALDRNLVIAVMHAPTAADAVDHLMRMTGEPTLVSASLLLVIAQAAVEATCEVCRDAADLRIDPVMRLAAQRDDLLVTPCVSCTVPSGRKQFVAFDALESTPALQREIAMIDGSATTLSTVSPSERFRAAGQRPARGL